MAQNFRIENGVLIRYHGSAEEVVIPYGVKSIGAGAFKSCSSLVSITIPDSVTSIGDEAFMSCRRLTEITIPAGVTRIGDKAFKFCSGLTDITIPETVTSIGYGAFDGCNNLESITIPNGVTCIEDYIYAGCFSLKSITIPEGVTSIGKCSFYGCCSSLKSIEIPSSVTDIGRDAFSETPWLSDQRDENGLPIVNHILLDGKPCFGDVKVPDGVTSIGDGAFRDGILKSIEIPDSVTNIGEDAFEDCENLTIYGTNNSYAQEYAWKNNISFFEVTEHLPEIKNLSEYLITAPPEHPLFLRAMSQVLFFKRDSGKVIPAAKMYEEFLAGERKDGKTDIYDLITPTNEPERRYGTSYAIVDSTGDGIPELHIQSGHGYIIYSYKNNEMFELERFESRPWYYYLLNNGAFIYSDVMGEEAFFHYFELDDSGNHINDLSFSWKDDNEEYEFDGDLCTKDEWFARTRKYLFTDEEGREQIRNQAELTTYCEDIW